MLNLRLNLGLIFALGMVCLTALGCPREDTEGQLIDPPVTSAASSLDKASFAATFIVTVKPLELILREVCGERASVSTLLKAGANSHTYDPTPADALAIQKAGGFFWVGPDYDAWAADFSSAGTVSMLSLVPEGMLMEMAVHGEWELQANADHGHGHGHDHETGQAFVPDPHFAVDPLLVKALLPKLAAKLSELDPEGKAVYESNAAAFAAKLDTLDSELRTILKPIEGQPVMMFHPSFNYFLKRYGLRYAGSIEPFPGKEPSPKYLQGVVKTIRSTGARAVFTETLLPAAPAQVIAEAAGVPVFELDPACGNSGHEYKDYADWLRCNADIFLKALGH